MIKEMSNMATARAFDYVDTCTPSQLVDLLKEIEQRVSGIIGCCTGIEDDRCRLAEEIERNGNDI